VRALHPDGGALRNCLDRRARQRSWVRVMVIGCDGEVLTRTDDLRAEAARPERDCRECGHTMVSHDAIAVRFCRASRDGALPRGCVCTNK